MNRETKIFLEIRDNAEDADEALQRYWPELENVVNKEIQVCMEKALEKIQHIQRIVENAVGGPEQLVRLRRERGK
jgi:hypothetical protein